MFEALKLGDMFNSEFFKNNSQAIVFTIPICWGIYEFRKFHATLKLYLPIVGDLNRRIEIMMPIMININEKVNNLSSGEGDTFPVVKKFEQLTTRINTMFTRLYASPESN